MGKGYIKLHRDITTNWLWEEKPFSYGQAWIDLLLLANWKDGKELYNHRLMDRKAGTVYVSKQWLADRWGWSRKKVDTFIGNLEMDNMVSTKSTTQGTTLTIENWAKWQEQGATQDTTQGETQEQPENSPRTAREHTKESIRKNNNFFKKEQENGLAEMLERKQAVLDKHPEIKNGKLV